MIAMSREWKVHAQLTISQPSTDQDNVTGHDQSGPHGPGQNGGAIAGDPQKNDKPITIVYQWTTADDPNSTANLMQSGVGSSENAAIFNKSETVRSWKT